MDIPILYLDEHILIVNKPAGLPILPDGWEKGAPYLLQQLQERFGRLWMVHRLDKSTTGVMVFARNAESHRGLNTQFEKHEAQKVYHAIVIGVPAWSERIAKHPLRSNVGHKHRTMVDNRDGKKSETRFVVLERYRANALLKAMPMSGRTHQIRVHAYALGHPLLGDTLYSAPETDLIARPALHAESLTIIHPQSTERLTFSAPCPPDFETAMKAL